VVPTISFRLLYGSPILRHSRRDILWLGVTARPNAERVAGQLTEAYGWQMHRNTLFATGIASMAMPSSSGFVRWAFGIGRSHRDRHGKMDIQRGSSARSEETALIMSSCSESGTFATCWDRTILQRRSHAPTLNKDAPASRAVQAVGRIVANPHLGGLHHQYVRI
jgi:hypothetical protein